MKPKILLLDIETFPVSALTWDHYEATVLEVKRPSLICCYSAKWLYGEQVTGALPDFVGYRAGQENDRKLVQRLWTLLDDADIVIAHHGDKFDLRVCNARFAYYGFLPPSPYKSIDTKKVASRLFRFGANSLDHLCQYLGVGAKMPNGGYDLWRRCMAGDMDAWKLMKSYCANDTRILEQLYLKLLPWINNHPNTAMYKGVNSCPKCGSEQLQYRGVARSTTRSYKRFQCKDCGGWGRSTVSEAAVRVTNA